MSASTAQNRLAAVSSSLAYPQGLLKGDVAVITGAAQGIGRSVALLFAAEGAKVVVSDLDGSKAQAVVNEIKQAGGQAVAVAGDVTDPAFPKKVVEEAVKAFGSIEHLILNAGFTSDKMLHGSSDETYELMLKVHNVAPFRLIREAAPFMRAKDADRKARNKSIVTVSSVAGLHGNVGQANYATAKAGIVGLTKTVAKEWGPFGVRANCVAFGHILTRLTQAKELGETIEVGGKKIALGIPSGPKKKDDGKPESYPHIPLNRPGTADDAAKAVLFLASPLASYVSGHTLECTGGMGI
ncbi:hypothetical protein JCM11641_003395 [Rhodosporidiobolus odoratus]